MTLLVELATWSFLAFGAVLFLAQFAACEIGHWIGWRQAKRGVAPREGVGVVVAGIMALLAFVLALTLTNASDRFTERRSGALEEANAIGTAWLRAKAIGNPRGEEIARLLQDYTQVRIDIVTAANDRAVIDQLNRRTSALQTTIWGHVAAIIRERADPISASLMASVNDTFDTTTAERYAFDFKLPAQLIWLLIGMTVVATGALGYQLGLMQMRLRVITALLSILWTAIIVNVLDLGTARIGSFRTTAAAYEWTLQSMQSGVPIPPPPAP